MIIMRSYTLLKLSEHHVLLAIRNLSQIREYTRSQDLITEESHLSWVKTLVNNPNKNYYAVFHEEHLIGGIHLLHYDTTAEWGIFFDPSASAAIISTVALHFINRFFEAYPNRQLVSTIHQNNEAALRFNHQLGFTMLATQPSRDNFISTKLDKHVWNAKKEGKILKNILKYASKYTIEVQE